PDHLHLHPFPTRRSSDLGCVALHEFEDGISEMKRLYVRPAFRGKRVGLALANGIIAAAREIGYQKMRLDTVPSEMADAVKMYGRDRKSTRLNSSHVAISY